MSAEFVYLASSSPRRRELLAQIGVPCRVLPVSVDETVVAGESPEDYVLRLSRLKAVVGCSLLPAAPLAPVLAADTAVVLDGKVLVKPTDSHDAVRMLCKLSGRTHEVLTAIALRSEQGLVSRLSRSTVTFRTITPVEAQDYWDTGEPYDKAGGYAVQGCGAVFITDLRGSYSGVMGLPLYETAELLELARVPRWQRAASSRSFAPPA